MKTSMYPKTISVLAVTIALAGCGQGGGQGAAPADGKAPVESVEAFTKEPVKLTLYNNGAGINTATDLQKVILDPVQKMYPNITIELLAGKKLEDLIAAGETPDIISTSNFSLDTYIGMGLGSDLNQFVKTFKIDLNRFEPETIKNLRLYGKNGEIYGFPFAMNYGMTAYNKDIFDKYGVPYLKDGMTWEQVIDLSKKMTRSQDSTQILGIDPGFPQLFSRAYSIPATVDGKAVLATDGYKKMFSYLRSVYDIPGMVETKTNYLKDNIDFFTKEQRVAIKPYWISAFTSRVLPLVEQNQNFNWDMVSFPSFADKPGYGREVDFHLLMVTPASKNKDAAYRVLQAIQTTEAQSMINKFGRLSVLNDPAIQKDFASDLKIFEGKNLAGIFSVKPAPLPRGSMYDSKMYSILNEANKDMITGGKDINTVLREAEEKANKYIEEEKLKQQK
ncbi:ABC transporter substrate-binding protein [Paenibacillus ginsengarvi]|uniref:Extracellular solute-binding protein n=1 Tax=Paenibacillus ginsengarvi TaxID=400777 RepID=A0A3B0CPA5_9BACL|nr:extracellular solute-binding protein [Paenibacillus ginsengarvi]RKN86164.1 extracellular solute-binding protein [Paenibacillus ginsengarvi]